MKAGKGYPMMAWVVLDLWPDMVWDAQSELVKKTIDIVIACEEYTERGKGPAVIRVGGSIDSLAA